MRNSLHLVVLALSLSTTACLTDPTDGEGVTTDDATDGKADSTGGYIRQPYANQAVEEWIDVRVTQLYGSVALAYPNDLGHPLATGDVYKTTSSLRVPASVPEGAELTMTYTTVDGKPGGTRRLVHWTHPEDVLFTDRTTVTRGRTLGVSGYVSTLNYRVQGIGHGRKWISVVNDATGESVFAVNGGKFVTLSWPAYQENPGAYFFDQWVNLGFDSLPPQGSTLRISLVDGNSAMTTQDCIVLDREANSVQQVACR